MGSASTPPRSASEPELLDLDFGLTPDDIRHLEEIRSIYPIDAERYFAWLDDCWRHLPQPVDLFTPTEKFDRPFELPPDDFKGR